MKVFPTSGAVMIPGSGRQRLFLHSTVSLRVGMLRGRLSDTGLVANV